MNYILSLTIASAIASILGFFIPDKWRNKKVIMSLCLFFLIFISGWISNLESEIERKNNIYQKAQELIDGKEMNFTSRGYIQACLSFLESNKDIYPDSYENGKKIEADLKKELKEDKYFTSEVAASYEIEGIIKGIAILNH